MVNISTSWWENQIWENPLALSAFPVWAVRALWVPALCQGHSQDMDHPMTPLIWWVNLCVMLLGQCCFQWQNVMERQMDGRWTNGLFVLADGPSGQPPRKCSVLSLRKEETYGSHLYMCKLPHPMSESIASLAALMRHNWILTVLNKMQQGECTKTPGNTATWLVGQPQQVCLAWPSPAVRLEQDRVIMVGRTQQRLNQIDPDPSLIWCLKI